jgi:hypothetical protein
MLDPVTVPTPATLRFVAPVTDQDSMALCPLATHDGLAEKLVMTGGAEGVPELEPPPQPTIIAARINAATMRRPVTLNAKAFMFGLAPMAELWTQVGSP